MIVLKVSNTSELVHSFRSANGGLGIVPYPLFNKIKAELKNERHNEHTYIYISQLKKHAASYHCDTKLYDLKQYRYRTIDAYLIFWKAHLDNTLRIFCGVERVSIISFPAIKIRRVLSMLVIGCNLGKKLVTHAPQSHVSISFLLCFPWRVLGHYMAIASSSNGCGVDCE